jgi:hypothetical protein
MPRPKGLPKTGGRRKGAKNRVTIELEKIAAKAAAKPRSTLIAALNALATIGTTACVQSLVNHCRIGSKEAAKKALTIF